MSQLETNKETGEKEVDLEPVFPGREMAQPNDSGVQRATAS